MSQNSPLEPDGRSCLRKYFEVTRTPYRNNGTYKESWCLGCLEQTIKEILEADARAVVAGNRLTVRTREEASVVAHGTTTGMPISSSPDTLAVHIKKCKLCIPDEAMRAAALEEWRLEKAAKSQQRARPVFGNITNVVAAGQPQGTYVSTATLQPVPLLAPQVFAAMQSAPVFWQPPPPSASLPATPRQPVPLQRTDTIPDLLPPNATDVQQEFAADLCRLFIALNLAWNAAANPEFRWFFTKWVPRVTIPDRRTLSGSVLRIVKQKAVDRVKSKVNGKLAMLQCDGWKNVARINIITSMMTVENESYLIHLHNMFGQPKTGDMLWELVRADLERARTTYGIDAIGICTDDGPDGKKMRRLACEAMPWWIITVCWAHQNQLIIGDLIKRVPWLKRVIELALKVAKWFMNHGSALAFLHKQQLRIPGTSRTLMLLLPVITRSGAHYFSVARLLKLKAPLRGVVVHHEPELLELRSRANDEDEDSSHAADIIHTVLDQDFWMCLACVKEHMEPLAISSNILQALNCGLGCVLLTLGNLVRIFSGPHVHEDIGPVVIASIEARWKRADQEPFILAVLFNPYIRELGFNDTHLPRAALVHMCRRAYERFFQQDATIEFWDACHRYLKREGRFSDDYFSLDFHREHAASKKTDVDLVRLWRDLKSAHATAPDDVADQQVIRLAILILSAIGNSTACEQNFSRFGNIHTRHCNRLTVESTHDINFVRMDIKARHEEAGLKPNRLKRRNGDDGSSSSLTSTSSTASTSRVGEPCPEDLLAAAARALLASNTAADPTDIDQLEELQQDAIADADEEFTPTSAAYRKIVLKDLFLYPVPGVPLPANSPLLFYWNGPVKDLKAKEAVHEAAQTIV